MLDWIIYIAGILGLISFATYMLPWLLDSCLLCEQNLRRKYNAEWSVVTGASSGIGRAVVEKLAKQGVNVVMVALANDMLDEVHAQFEKEYPDIEFRKVGVNLGTPGYLAVIEKATEDIQPNLIFNNAGFIMTGQFANVELPKHMVNYECNATAPVKITHHFLNRMLDAGQKGAIFFTSSPAGLMPCPITVLYGATKAFLTEFATSIAPEVKPDGIDVMVVHPSPVDTGFYSGNNHGIDAMKFFQKTATTPITVASCFFRSIGRTVVHDQGYFSISLKMLLKVLDYNFLSIVIQRTATMSADYQLTKKPRGGASASKATKRSRSRSKKD